MQHHQTTLQTTTTHLTNYISTTFSRSNPYFSSIHPQIDEISDDDDGLFSSSSSSDHCFFSNSFVFLDVIWNMGLVLISSFVLFSTFHEKPSSPLRVWIVGYVLQCFLHVGFCFHEFRCRNFGRVDAQFCSSSSNSSIVKRLESANTIASSLWWAFGFYWIVTGGPSLLLYSPRLYWLAVVFLALDVFFMMFCIGVACIVCVTLFCCIPIVAIAYAMTIREGASADDIRQLPKYTFHCSSSTPKISTSMWLGHDGAGAAIDDSDSRFELPECCICLTRYGEGAELCSLPCNHHFHTSCISRWLRINATCPLCKFNIKAKGDSLV